MIMYGPHMILYGPCTIIYGPYMIMYGPHMLGEQDRNPLYGILALPIWVNFKVFGQF